MNQKNMWGMNNVKLVSWFSSCLNIHRTTKFIKEANLAVLSGAEDLYRCRTVESC
jgi:hypothetical protein